jgi:methionyl-tRNA formyltransferase
MRVLFLTNNDASLGLAKWLQEQGEDLDVHGDRLSPGMARPYGLVLSYGYRHIIPASELFGPRFVNLHISLLPWNRGADPNVWSHLEETPCGVSVHEIDQGVDTGPILAQAAMHFNDSDTLAGSYDALQQAVQALLREAWPRLRDGRLPARPQMGRGSRHLAAEFMAVRERLLGAEGWEVRIGDLRARWHALRSEGRAPG